MPPEDDNQFDPFTQPVPPGNEEEFRRIREEAQRAEDAAFEALYRRIEEDPPSSPMGHGRALAMISWFANTGGFENNSTHDHLMQTDPVYNNAYEEYVQRQNAESEEDTESEGQSQEQPPQEGIGIDVALRRDQMLRDLLSQDALDDGWHQYFRLTDLLYAAVDELMTRHIGNNRQLPPRRVDPLDLRFFSPSDYQDAVQNDASEEGLEQMLTSVRTQMITDIFAENQVPRNWHDYLLGNDALYRDIMTLWVSRGNNIRYRPEDNELNLTYNPHQDLEGNVTVDRVPEENQPPPRPMTTAEAFGLVNREQTSVAPDGTINNADSHLHVDPYANRPDDGEREAIYGMDQNGNPLRRPLQESNAELSERIIEPDHLGPFPLRDDTNAHPIDTHVNTDNPHGLLELPVIAIDEHAPITEEMRVAVHTNRPNQNGDQFTGTLDPESHCITDLRPTEPTKKKWEPKYFRHQLVITSKADYGQFQQVGDTIEPEYSITIRLEILEQPKHLTAEKETVLLFTASNGWEILSSGSVEIKADKKQIYIKGTAKSLGANTTHFSMRSADPYPNVVKEIQQAMAEFARFTTNQPTKPIDRSKSRYDALEVDPEVS